MTFALTGARVFDGERFHDGAAVVVVGARVTAIVPGRDLPAGIERRRLDGGTLAPGFVDVQVNGGGGALLNRDPSADVVRTIAASHRRFGTVAMLPTVITDAAAVIAAAIAAVHEARAGGVASVAGIHVEGPFLDVARKGAHDPRYIRNITDADVAKLAEAATIGTVMLTLAPNRVAPAVIRTLVERGIRVSLGHSDAHYDEVRAALDAGATAFTHLYNAMSQLGGREPGMVGAALTDKTSFIGIIADGHHIHDAALRLALAATSHDRFMLVSDAMPPAAGGPDAFTLQGRRVLRVSGLPDGGRLQLDDGTLAGSNLTMDAALRYCVERLGVPLATALRMASRNPARFLGRDDLGHIAPGALASLVHLDAALRVTGTWVEGAS